MDKVLKPSTIIPADLYVDRQADRQLNRIVEDMGRPGYVLVARQMGKTNLLLAMKRRRTARGDFVLYLDLSNRLASARAFFRNIVDSLFESSDGALDRYIDAIAELRRQDLEPNVEYDRSLRRILRGEANIRLIIIFDEVDSLINVAYSDQILSQVRSMYFARASYPEYYRLTYTLSGVIEPANLIKDRNISPFNIGEKIYLGDFSQEEFVDFLERANLQLTSETSAAVYDWTGGNPRMTWDVCSKLEDTLRLGETLDAKGVEAIVRGLYLHSFDLAPVDHIRDLVERDSRMRDAVVSLRYGKGGTLDETSKNRLYLAGITSSEAGDDLRIKNRVIDEALSEDWLRQLNINAQQILRTAERAYKSGDHRENIRLLEDYIRTAPLGERLPFPHALNLGVSKIFVGDFQNAISVLSGIVDTAPDEGHSQSWLHYHLGIALLELGNAEQALPHLRVASDIEGDLKLDAMLRVGTALLRGDALANSQEVISISRAVVEQVLASSAPPSEEFANLLASAKLQSATALANLGDNAAAEADLDLASEIAPLALKPSIFLMRSSMASSRAEQVRFAQQAAAAIVDSATEAVVGVSADQRPRRKELALVLARLGQLKQGATFDALLDHASSPIFGLSRSTSVGVLIDLYKNFESESEREQLTPLLRVAATRRASSEEEKALIFDAVRILAVYAPDRERSTWLQAYLQQFSDNVTSATLTMDDLLLIGANSASLFHVGDYRGAERLYSLIKPLEEAAVSLSPAIYLLLLNFEMSICNIQRRIPDAKAAAHKLIKLFDDAVRDRTDGVAESVATIEGMRRAAIQLLAREELPIIPNKIGRNSRVRVRYIATGREATTKFKFVEADVRSGRAVMIGESETD